MNATPTDDRTLKLSSLAIEKSAPAHVEAHREFTYEIRLHNASETPVDVVLNESLLSVFRIVEASPPPQADEPHMARWVLGPIYPDETQVVRVRCRSEARLRFRSHTSLSFSQES